MQSTKRRSSYSTPRGDLVDLSDIIAHWLCLTNPQLVNRDSWLGKLRARRFEEVIAEADSLAATEYGDALQHLEANQLAAFIRKFPFTPSETPGLNPESKAWETFQRSEAKCKRTNRRLRFYRTVRVPSNYTEIIRQARGYILRVLGSNPPLEQIYDECRFGPGSSLGVTGDATNMGRKLTAERWSITPCAVPFFLGAMWHHATFREFILTDDPLVPYCLDREVFRNKAMARLEIVEHNKISMVPKTAKTARPIAIEPLGNTFLQLGVDAFMKKRLLRVGIDLRQQVRNQALAKLGSIQEFDPYATLDLSSASDSVSIELVRLLLPDAWFEFLDALRSPAYRTLDGVEVRYHKFCSMGNGFCFPLETLIFASLAYSVQRVNGVPIDFAVYGDDIVIPQSSALHLTEVLNHFGFMVNREKSFYFGPFRESCGKDYFRGVFVRPITLDERLDNIRSLIKFHNSCMRRGGKFATLVQELGIVKRIPKRFRFMRNLPGALDSALEVPKDIFMASGFVKWNRYQQRWSWKEFLDTAVRDIGPPGGFPPSLVMAAALSGNSSKSPYTLRRKTRTISRFI